MKKVTKLQKQKEIKAKEKKKKLEKEIKRIIKVCEYKLVCFEIGNSEETTFVTFLNTRLKKHTTTLRQLKLRDKNTFPMQERYDICLHFESLGYENFFTYPDNMEVFCKSLCDCLGYEFVSIENKGSKCGTRVYYKGGTNLVSTMMDKMYRRGRRLLNEAQSK